MNKQSTLYIDGLWQAAEDGSTFTVVNPADGSNLAAVSNATPADAHAAIAACARAQKEWGRTPAGVRTDLLRALHARILDATEEIADLIAAESGKPLPEARGEVAYGAQFVNWFADQASQTLHGDHYTDPSGRIRILTSRRPIGPSLLITPWNFPLAMVTRKLAPALAAGCTAVLKPAAQTPLTAVRLLEILDDVGIPAGVVNLVTTTRAREVSEAVFASPALRKLSFTGSTAVGSELLRAAARRVVNTSMELGGNAPLIVFADASPATLDEVVTAKLRNAGQSCIAANRILVEETIAAEFTMNLVERFADLRVGDGRATGTNIGPLIDSAAVAKISGLVDAAVAAGARIVYRAQIPADGCFYPPTVIVDVPTHSEIYRGEIFGPIATITTFTGEQNAIDLANDTDAGLAAYVFTADLDKAMRVGAELDFGIVGINRGFVSTAAAPFGGMKTSGLGREGGLHGLDEYLETQYLSLPVGSVD